jgi:hypothetical protein
MTERYWIAINGPSCAISVIPLRKPKVTPTPEQLFGFPNFEDAEKAQRIFLTDPVKTIHRFLRKLGADIEAGRVLYIRPEHPQPPTKGATAWTDSIDGHAIMQRAYIAGTSN